MESTRDIGLKLFSVVYEYLTELCKFIHIEVLNSFKDMGRLGGKVLSTFWSARPR